MAASRRMAALEQEVGARLVHRTTRSLSLTTEGEAFLPHAQAMLEGEAAARAAIRPSDAGASGLLRITASAAFGRKVVAPAAAEFMHANPEVSIDLLLTDSVVDIVAGGVDLAVRIAPLRDNSLVARRLADNPRALYAAPDYLERRGVPRKLADLAEHDCLVMSGATHWAFEAGGRQVQQKIAGRFTASGVEGLHQACLGALGVTPLSAWDVRDEVAAGHLVELPLEDAALPGWSIWAVYPTARQAPAKVRLFVAALAQRLGQG